ncbi:MAG: aldehyde dehydrogenase family protein [Verrucomicrobiota bacterium]
MNAEYPFLVDGQWRQSARSLEVTSPYDGEVAGITYQASPEDVEGAIQAATRAFEITKRLPTHNRAEILEKTVAGLKSRREEIARVIALEAGKPMKNARGEVTRAIATFTDAVEECKRLRGEWLPLDLDAASEGRHGLVRRFPLGPVAAITPFNFPLNLVSHKVAPALACGCSLVLKPATKTPLTALLLARIVTEAGAPPGMLNVLPCASRDAQPLITDDRLKLLTFTGSAPVGWGLKALAGKKRVALELGGNAGVAVHSDADLDYAAQRCVMGGFAYAGQACISVQRIYVHRPVFDAFAAKLVALTARLKLGNPLDEATDVGPMISLEEAQRAQKWVQEAVAQGAKILLGGGRDGLIMHPTILTSTRPAMRVCCQELFAPVVTLEPYDDFRQAVHAINDSAYGLQAGIFTRDVQAIFSAFEELEVGGLLMNDVPTWRSDPMPYGGMKDSGNGREGVRYAMEEMTERKILVFHLTGNP